VRSGCRGLLRVLNHALHFSYEISNAIGYAKFSSPSHDAVIRVYDGGLPNPRSARAMQDGVRLAFLHFLQQMTDVQCGRRNDLDTAPFRLR
jgi:hypothetical protein